jgi:hypothetical protein
MEGRKITMSEQAGAAPAAAAGVTVSGPTGSSVVQGATSAAAQPASSAAAAGAASGQAPWYATFQDDLKGYAETKGWKDPGMVVESYRNLEKLVGLPEDKIVKLPAKEDDVEAWKAVHQRLGAPKEAKDYAIKAPEGSGGEAFDKWARETFLELGVTKKQAETLTTKWSEYVSGKLAEASQTYQTTIQAQESGLRKEWGAAYDKHIQSAKTAAVQFGFDAATIDKLEGALGFDGVMKFLSNVGTKVGEGEFVSSGQPTHGFGGVMTPAAAQHRINSLRADNDFVKKYTAGDVSARAEMEHLHKMLSPE